MAAVKSDCATTYFRNKFPTITKPKMAAMYDHLLFSRNFSLALSRGDFFGFFVDEDDALDFLLELTVVDGFLEDSAFEEDPEFMLLAFEVSENTPEGLCLNENENKNAFTTPRDA